MALEVGVVMAVLRVVEGLVWGNPEAVPETLPAVSRGPFRVLPVSSLVVRGWVLLWGSIEVRVVRVVGCARKVFLSFPFWLRFRIC